MSVNFDVDAGQANSFEPNYFHMLDQALVFHSIELSAVNATKRNKTVLVKELLTTDGVFNKILFEFLNWIISENDREIFLSKTCHIKFIHTAANQELLKIFIQADSRCLLNYGHKLWVNKCFTGWKKKCIKDNKTAEIEKVDRMIKEIDEVFGQNPYDTDDSTVTFESTPAPRTPPRAIKAKVASPEKPTVEKPSITKTASKSNLENEAPHPFDPEIDLVPQHRGGGGGGYHGPIDDGGGYYGGYHSAYPPMRGGPLPPRPSMDMDLYYAAELGRELVHRKSMTFNGGSSMYNTDFIRQDRELELLKNSRDMEIMNLKRELSLKQTIPYNSSRKNNDDSYGVAARDSTDVDDNSTVDARDTEFSEQKRLEKAMRDMMEYYDKALQAKDEQISNLQKELTEKGDQFAATMVENMKALEEARKFYVNDLETTGRASNESEERVQKELQFMKQSYEKLMASNEQKEAELRSKLEEKSEKLERAFGLIRKTLKDRTETFATEKAELEAQLESMKAIVANVDADKAALVNTNKEAMDRLRDELEVKLAKTERNFNVEKELVELEKRRMEREMREAKEVLAEKDLLIKKATEKHTADMEERAQIVQRYENLLSSKEADYSKMRRDLLVATERLANIESDHMRSVDGVRGSLATSYEEKRLQLEEEIRQLKDSQKNHNVHTTKKIQAELEKAVRTHEADLKFHTAAFNDERNRLKLRMQSLKESYENESKALRQQLMQKSEQLSQKTAANAIALEEARNICLRELESKSAAVDAEKYAIGKELSELQEKYMSLKEEMEVVMQFDQDRSDYIQELEDAVTTLQQENEQLDTELDNIRVLYYQQKTLMFPKIASSEGSSIQQQQPVSKSTTSSLTNSAPEKPVVKQTPAPLQTAELKVAVPTSPSVQVAVKKPLVDGFTQITVPIMSSASTQTESELKGSIKKATVSAETKQQNYMPSNNISRQDSYASIEKGVSVEQDAYKKETEYMPVGNNRTTFASSDVSPSPSPRPSSQAANFAFTQYVNMPRDSMLKCNSIADADMGEGDEFPLKVSLAPVKKSITMKVPKAALPAPSPSPAPAAYATASSNDYKIGDRVQQRNADVQKAKLQFQQKLMATESLIKSTDAADVAAVASTSSPSSPSPSPSTNPFCERFGVQQETIFTGGLPFAFLCTYQIHNFLFYCRAREEEIRYRIHL